MGISLLCGIRVPIYLVLCLATFLSWEIGGLGVFHCLFFLKGRSRGDGREGERKASSKEASEEE